MQNRSCRWRICYSHLQDFPLLLRPLLWGKEIRGLPTRGSEANGCVCGHQPQNIGIGFCRKVTGAGRKDPLAACQHAQMIGLSSLSSLFWSVLSVLLIGTSTNAYSHYLARDRHALHATQTTTTATEIPVVQAMQHGGKLI